MGSGHRRETTCADAEFGSVPHWPGPIISVVVAVVVACVAVVVVVLAVAVVVTAVVVVVSVEQARAWFRAPRGNWHGALAKRTKCTAPHMGAKHRADQDKILRPHFGN